MLDLVRDGGLEVKPRTLCPVCLTVGFKVVSLCGLYLGSYKVVPKNELLWILWVGSSYCHVLVQFEESDRLFQVVSEKAGLRVHMYIPA